MQQGLVELHRVLHLRRVAKLWKSEEHGPLDPLLGQLPQLGVVAKCASHLGWRPILAEALRAREQPGQISEYAGDPVARGRDTAAFATMAVESGLACGP